MYICVSFCFFQFIDLHFEIFLSCLVSSCVVVGAMASKKSELNVRDDSGVPIERSHCITGVTDTPSVVRSGSSSSISSSVEPSPGPSRTPSPGPSRTPSPSCSLQSSKQFSAKRKAPARGKLISISIKDKLDILNALEKGTKVREIVSKYKIGSSTVYDKKKAKNELRNFQSQQNIAAGAENLAKRKRLVTGRIKTIDESVYEWYKQQRSVGVPIRGTDLQDAADRFAKHLNIQNFTASNGWLFRFRSRHGISNRKICGESMSADESSVEPFCNRLNEIIESTGLEKSQIYNGDETGLFWKQLPENSQAQRNLSSVPGHKLNKQRLSALLVANADGSHRLKSAIVGHAKKPRAIKDVMDKLPVIYYHNKKAWFTQEIFSDWFFKHFIPEVRRHQTLVLKKPSDAVMALLLLDNAPSHPDDSKLISDDGKIKVLYLPPNTTSLIQPMDQGIIYTCKRHYRKKQLQDCLVVIPDDTAEEDTRGADTLAKLKAYNLRDAIYNWAESWQSVKVETLINCWNKLLRGVSEFGCDFEGFDTDDPFLNILEQCGETEVTPSMVREWLEDEEDPGHHLRTEEEIAADISGTEEVIADSDEDDSPPRKLRVSKAREAIDELLQFTEDCEKKEVQKFYATLRSLRQEIISIQ